MSDTWCLTLIEESGKRTVIESKDKDVLQVIGHVMVEEDCYLDAELRVVHDLG